MSAVLVVSTNKVQVRKFELDEPSVSIGRSQQCELVLSDPELSREHCRVFREGGTYKVEDKGSRNGTEVNGKVIGEPQPLQDGDVINLGDYQLTFYSTDTGLGDGEDEHDLEDMATRFVGSDDLRKAQDLLDLKEPKLSSNMLVKLTAVLGPLKGETYKAWGQELTLGRGLDNNVIIPDDAISTQHARIYVESGHNYLEDLGSSNGTFVDGARLRGKHLLVHGEKVRIGTSTFQYTQLDPVKQKAMRKKIILAAVAVGMLLIVAKVLQPEDKAAKYVESGKRYMQQEKFDDAIQSYQRALEVKPGFAPAQSGLSVAKSQAEAEQLLQEAEELAMGQQYAEALSKCHSVLRLHPKHRRAKELLAVVKQVEEAKVATNAQNWKDAIMLLEKALASYPDSEVLAARLSQCKDERASMRNLDAAKALLAEKKFAEARGAVADTKESSFYYQKVIDLLAAADNAEGAQVAYQEAKALYQAGDNAAAQARVDDALAKFPNNKILTALKDDIVLVMPLAAQLDKGSALLESKDVVGIRDMIMNCDKLLNMQSKSDVVDAFKEKAGMFQKNLKQRLAAISSDSTREGNRLMAAGDKRGALQAYVLAAEADEDNEVAVMGMKKIQNELVPLAREKYQEAVVHEELGQTELAKAAFEAVMEIAVPGDSYYTRAEKKLKKLSRGD